MEIFIISITFRYNHWNKMIMVTNEYENVYFLVASSLVRSWGGVSEDGTPVVRTEVRQSVRQ